VYVHDTFWLFIHLSLNTWFVHILTIVNTAAVCVGGQIFLQDPVFSSFGFISRSGISESYGNPIFNFFFWWYWGLGSEPHAC
jgi:hypothetical protein